MTACITKLYERVADIPIRNWIALSHGPADLAMDLRLLGAFESTMRGQCRCWFAIVRDDLDKPVAAAALCLFRIDALETTGPAIQSMTRNIRRLFPGYMRFNVLFCGLPVPSADNHLRILPGADRAAVLQSLDAAMRQLARANRARMIVLKEFDDTRRDELSPLEARGYVRGDVPAARQLESNFESFDDYCSALRAPYRKQVRESLRKFDRAGGAVEHLTGTRICDVMSDSMHSLYLAVRNRAQYRMETFPPEFFRAIANEFGDDAALTILRRGERVLGWAFSLTAGGECHNFYVGLDYERNAQADVYFNLHFRDLDRALRRGCVRIHLGQTSDAFKSRLGCGATPLSFYVRATNPLVHAGLRRFAHLVFPPMAQPTLLNVFRSEPAPSDRPGENVFANARPDNSSIVDAFLYRTIQNGSVAYRFSASRK